MCVCVGPDSIVLGERSWVLISWGELNYKAKSRKKEGVGGGRGLHVRLEVQC